MYTMYLTRDESITNMQIFSNITYHILPNPDKWAYRGTATIKDKEFGKIWKQNQAV